MRIMGLDFGKKTIGVAISDENSIADQPLKTILRASRDKDMEGLKGIIRAFDVSSVAFAVHGRTYGPQSDPYEFTVKAETGLPRCRGIAPLTIPSQRSSREISVKEERGGG